MKYLKLYEAVKEYSFQEWLETRSRINNIATDRLICTDRRLDNLKGIENFHNLRFLDCGLNKLTSLKYIKNLTKLEHLFCFENKLTSIKEVENLINLEELDCGINKLTNLDGIQNLNKLKILSCDMNQLKNLDELKELRLIRLFSNGNPFEMPIKMELLKNISKLRSIDIYGHSTKIFQTYEYQKWFLDEYPERVTDLAFIGFDEKIKEEYKELLEFFNIV